MRTQGVTHPISDFTTSEGGAWRFWRWPGGGAVRRQKAWKLGHTKENVKG